MLIRPATLSDVDSIEKLLRKYYEEGNMKRLQYDHRTTTIKLFEYIVYKDSDILVADDDKIVGVSFLEMVQPLFTEGWVAENRILYVAKEHRGSMAGTRLIKKSRSWAKEHGASYLMIGTSSEINTDRTEKLYSKLGFKRVGSDFIAEI